METEAHSSQVHTTRIHILQAQIRLIPIAQIKLAIGLQFKEAEILLTLIINLLLSQAQTSGTRGKRKMSMKAAVII